MFDMDNETIVLINEGKYTELELEKIFALKALKANPTILDNPISFEKLCSVLNDIKPNMETFEPASVLMLAKALSIIKEHEWNNEIIQYIAHVAHGEGWLDLPKELKFAEPALKALQIDIEELDEDALKLQELKHKAVERYLDK